MSPIFIGVNIRLCLCRELLGCIAMTIVAIRWQSMTLAIFGRHRLNWENQREIFIKIHTFYGGRPAWLLHDLFARF